MKQNDFTLIHTMYIKDSNIFITSFINSISYNLHSSITCFNCSEKTIDQKKCNKSIVSKFYRYEENNNIYITSGNHYLRFALVGKDNKISVNLASPSILINKDTLGFDADVLFETSTSNQLNKNSAIYLNPKYIGKVKTGINCFHTPSFQSIFVLKDDHLLKYFQILNDKISLTIINKDGILIYNNKSYSLSNCSIVLFKDTFEINFSLENENIKINSKMENYIENKNFITVFSTTNLNIDKLNIVDTKLYSQLIIK